MIKIFLLMTHVSLIWTLASAEELTRLDKVTLVATCAWVADIVFPEHSLFRDTHKIALLICLVVTPITPHVMMPAIMNVEPKVRLGFHSEDETMWWNAVLIPAMVMIFMVACYFSIREVR